MQSHVQTLPREDVARIGNEVYATDIRPKLSASDRGRFVAIDVLSRDYEIDDDESAVCHNLWRRRPSAQIWVMRVGFKHLRHYGGSARRDAE